MKCRICGFETHDYEKMTKHFIFNEDGKHSYTLSQFVFEAVKNDYDLSWIRFLMNVDGYDDEKK